MTKTKFLLLALAVAALPSLAAASTPNLCTSVPGFCEYIPAQGAPELNAAVCYSAALDRATLKVTPKCPTGERTLLVGAGEVLDIDTLEVAGYIPLGNACNAGHCHDFAPHQNGQESAICCEDGGPCWPGGACGGDLYWCHDGVSNLDGTVTCFDAEEM